MLNITTHTNNQGAASTALHRHLALTAFTTEGEPLTVTTWFAAQDGVLYIALPATSSLVGAIRQNAEVSLVPTSRSGEARGHSVTGHAYLVPQFETVEARAALDRKYGVVAGVSHLVANDQGLGGEVLIAIRPEAGLGMDDLLRETLTLTDDGAAVRRILGFAAIGAVLGAGIALAIIARRRS